MKPEQSNPLGVVPPHLYGVPRCFFASAIIAAAEPDAGAETVVSCLLLPEVVLVLVFVFAVADWLLEVVLPDAVCVCAD